MKGKSKKTKFSVWLLGRLMILVFVGFISFSTCQKIIEILKGSGLFKVKEVFYDPSLEFIRDPLVVSLVGKNLFAIDASRVHRQLERQYPQIGNLRVVKKFPNQILIIAKQRLAFSQAKFGNMVVSIDKSGVALGVSTKADHSLPLITGMKNSKPRIIPGHVIADKNLWLALRLLKSFQKSPALSKHKVVQIDISNPAQIYIFLLENFKVIVDNENVDQKLRILDLLLSEGRLEFKKVNYIDLRFSEPILGKK